MDTRRWRTAGERSARRDSDKRMDSADRERIRPTREAAADARDWWARRKPSRATAPHPPNPTHAAPTHRRRTFAAAASIRTPNGHPMLEQELAPPPPAATARPPHVVTPLAVGSWVLYDLANTIFSMGVVSLYFS